MTWLVVGLGNPDPSYAGHRHNVGHQVVDELARRHRMRFRRAKKVNAETAEIRLGPPGPESVPVTLAKARTFVNDTGGPVAGLTAYLKVPPDRLVAVHDELDLDLGRIRLKLGGGDNGHNGLRSMRRSLSTGDFYRVRVGIGRPPGRQDPADFVLSNFPAESRDEVAVEVARAADAIESLVTEGLEAAQNRFNT